MGISSCAVTLFLLSNIMLSRFSNANVSINFGDKNWDSKIRKSGNPENRLVVADPATGRGQVLRVSYRPSTLYGTQFDYPAFSQSEDPVQACLSYQVFFENNFDFAKGGKLPGLYGGPNRCSGGRHDNCFSTRMMWRTGGIGEVYIYMTKRAEEQSRSILCRPTGTPGVQNICSPTMGWSYQRGAVSFQRGTWNTVRQRVRMNTIGRANGELEVTVNGRTIRATGLTWRTSRSEQVTIRGLFFSTFFGGNDSSWAPSRDVTAFFKNISFGRC